MSRAKLWNQLFVNRTRSLKRTSRKRTSNIRIEQLESRQLLAAEAFKLELLHVADQEGATAAIQDAPRFSAVLNALRAEGVADGQLTLSSGDAFIPSPFFDASAGAFGAAGVGDIQIQNELGIQAIALGNHEFDLGTGTLAGLIDGSAGGTILGAPFAGAEFPYLSTNLDLSTDGNLAGSTTPGGANPLPATLTSSVVLEAGGHDILVVGATTPTLASISSPGGVTISPSPFDPNPTSEQLDALAAEIQAEVDLVLGDNPDINKVILLAHMQQIDIEQSLAERLSDVDIIVAGGSNTRLFDSDDIPREGDSTQGEYPIFVTNADGTSTAVVNTDGSYKYVGRLVIEFDADGNLVPESYDASVSGAYATDDAGVARLGAADLVDPEILEIVGAIEAQIIATESNVFGISDVFLNGNRSGIDGGDDPDGVRTQETNLGNLTADANLAEASAFDSEVVISIKNGGGIRASVGEVFVPAGGTEAIRTPNAAIIGSDGSLIKPAGGVSQNDISTVLAFNNGLSLLTLTRDELIDVLEHGVGAIPGVSGRFPQISGVTFSYDPALPVGERIINAAVVDEDGSVVKKLVADGERLGDADDTYRIVSLDFLVSPRFDSEGNFVGAGDGYPFPNTNADPTVGEVATPEDLARINLVQLEDALAGASGAANFTDAGSEQDALAEYLAANFADADNAYSEEDLGRFGDLRIQNLAFRTDTVFPVRGTIEVTSDADFGPGTFREAVQTASNNPRVRKIVFARDVDQVVLGSPVEYTGSQDLKIVGKGVVLQATDGFEGDGVFISSAAADLVLSRLTIDGDFEKGEPLANGIFIPVPADAEGKVSLRFDRVTIINNALHGIHVADQINDSAAGIDFIMRRSTVVNNGIGTLDFDGIRVDEGGDGDLHADFHDSNIDGNGGDGLELDERGNGSVFAHVTDTTFNENGFFDQDNTDPETQDLDDGFDIDEAGEGGIHVTVEDSEAINNFDEGFDFDEEDGGGVWMKFDDVIAEGNTDEGIKAEELAGGSLIATLYNVRSIGNGDGDLSAEEGSAQGIELEEFGDGNVFARLYDVQAADNTNDGIKIEESDAGYLSASLSNVKSGGNDGSGIKIEEAGDGSLFAGLYRVASIGNDDGLELVEGDAGVVIGSIKRSEFNENGGIGIIAEQEAPGFGFLRVWDVEAEDNGDAPVELDGVRLFGHIDD